MKRLRVFNSRSITNRQEQCFDSFLGQPFVLFVVVLSICMITECAVINHATAQPAAGLPAEGNWEPFIGEPKMETKQLFDGGRFPNVVVALDGTVLTFWGKDAPPQVRRSEDGGATWGPTIKISDDPDHSGRGMGAAVVDETTGDVIMFMEGTGEDWSTGQSWRSRDHGKSWKDNGKRSDIVSPNESIRINGQKTTPSRGLTHGHDSGITLRHGQHKGRLLISARAYEFPGANSKLRYNCAIYSDDHGETWHTSEPFPEFGTGEGALAELSDGTIYYNSRRHWAPDGKNPRRRWEGWSYDGGKTWENVSINRTLPDGAQDRDYGCMGGLTRLPVEGEDVLIFSNIISDSGRKNGHVWASFDGGKTWPIKRRVEEGNFAYSSLTSGRPGTPSEGWVYLLYEADGYGKGVIARFNLSWLLEGTPTGDGEIPTKFEK